MLGAWAGAVDIVGHIDFAARVDREHAGLGGETLAQVSVEVGVLGDGCGRCDVVILALDPLAVTADGAQHEHLWDRRGD